MKVPRKNIKKFVNLSRARASQLCVFVTLACVALVAGAGILHSQVQSEPSPAPANSSPPASTQALVPTGQGQPQVNEAPAAPKSQIAEDSANLLNLASGLKAEVDKTSRDTLSILVIKKANEIEQLAHRMRTK